MLRLVLVAALVLPSFAGIAGEEVSPEEWLLKRHGLSISLPKDWRVVVNGLEFRVELIDPTATKSFFLSVMPPFSTMDHRQPWLQVEELREEIVRKFEDWAMRDLKNTAKINTSRRFEVSGAPGYELEAIPKTEGPRWQQLLVGIFIANCREYVYYATCSCTNIHEDPELGKILRSLKLLGKNKAKYEQDFVGPGDDPARYRYKPTKKDIDFLEKIRREVEGNRGKPDSP